MKRKRFVSLFLALIMCFGLSTPSLAVNVNKSEALSDKAVMAYALNFMTEAQNNHSLKIKDFIPLYLNNEQISGYYVTFCDKDVPAGYVLLSLLTEGSPVVEFSLEGSGPLEIAEASNQLSAVKFTDESLNIVDKEKILYTGPGQLYISIDSKKYYSVFDNKIREIPLDTATLNSESSGSISISGGIIDWANASINTNSVFKIKNFGEGTDYWLMTQFSSGAVCVPTAATNILWYWGKMRGSSKVMSEVSGYGTDKAKATAIFNTLKKFMGTDLENGTKDSKTYAGYSGFFGSPPDGQWNYKILSNGTSFNTYKTELNNNCPIQVILHTKDGLLDKGDGHHVMAFGYANSTSGTPYLFVMDGWNNYGRFVKFNYYPYISGYKIWVAS